MSKFDLDRTRELAVLFQTAADERDEAWRDRFYAAIPDASLTAFQPQVYQGPDGFPYFHLAMPDAGPFETFCVSHLIDVVIENGFGIAIFGDASRSRDPEWVFTYGDLLAYHLYGNFNGPREEESEPSEQVLVAAPSEEYLPSAARKVIGEFIRKNYQHPDPRAGLVMNPNRHLVVNLSLEDYQGDEQRLSSAMHYLTWFLPRHYSLVAKPADWDEQSFVPLG